MPRPEDLERLGSFYLGRVVGDDGAVRPEPLLYDANDLVTHAVCLGMTGSGKTGLCIDLLEEAAIDGVPAIAIDPKGDLANLLLTFPSLSPDDFLPWIDEGEAARAGHTPEEQARAVAEQWRRGLAEWDQGPERIRRLRDAADLALYTPGSRAGRPLSVLRSLAAPPAELRDDPDALQERVAATVSGLLVLLGEDPDPIQSRSHILLSRILEAAWREGRDLALADLIQLAQSPPFDTVGVFDLESFYPSGERRALAMRLNALLASPGFAAWMQGDPLDVGRLLTAPDGRPRLSVLSIAHLSDAERMFFVTLLLNEVVAWTRSQPGTRSLRALLYMDEVFGYLPPVASPPSKTPLLTLLKQARAYGLGVVLATQNPVDLDYKALSNIGTWMLGRLQTERDKARLLDGLEAATSGAGLPRAELDRILSGLGSRVFLLHDVHQQGPVRFQTRWALSYLRGPLTREQIRRLCAQAPQPADTPAEATPAVELGPAAAADAPRPVLPPGVVEHFAGATTPAPPGATLRYRPTLAARVALHYANARYDVDVWQTVAFRAPLEQDAPGGPWQAAKEVPPGLPPGGPQPTPGASLATLPASALRAASWERWRKMLATHAYRDRPLRLLKCADPRAISRPGEERASFLGRLRQLHREARDLAVEKLRASYAPRLARLEQRVHSADERVEREEAQYEGQKMHTAISVGATLLGALLGRRIGVGTVGRAATAARGASRAAREHDDVARAREDRERLAEDLKELEASFQQELQALQAEGSAAEPALEEVPVRARKADVGVEELVLLWEPWWLGADGSAQPARDLSAAPSS